MYEFIIQIKNEDQEVILIHKMDYFEILDKGFTKRSLEKAGVQQLLSALELPVDLIYSEHGKPYFPSEIEKNLSISHRRQYIAVALSKDTIGVDIDYYTENLNRSKTYFLSEREQKVEWEREELLLIWTAKEALYKKIGDPNVKPEQDFYVERLGSEYQIWFKEKVYYIHSFSFETGWLLTWV